MLSGRVPDLSAMQLLSAVDRSGSLSAAAHEMGYSQQAASSRMRSLEAQIGAELVHRSPTGSQLTQTGRLVAGWAHDVLSAAERMDFGITALHERRATRMRIAASLTTSAHLVPTWLVELHRQQLRVGAKPTDVELITGNSAKVLDLVRNDIGRVCATGSVTVPDLCVVEKHPGLVHLVSAVRGELRADAGWPELLGAAFPPGSVTGAPKSSALRIIEALEPVPRGPYCGGIGWVDADRGTAELAVGIRTFWIDRAEGVLRFGTGAGITWGSDPEAEWRETELKAARLLAVASGAYEVSEGTLR